MNKLIYINIFFESLSQILINNKLNLNIDQDYKFYRLCNNNKLNEDYPYITSDCELCINSDKLKSFGYDYLYENVDQEITSYGSKKLIIKSDNPYIDNFNLCIDKIILNNYFSFNYNIFRNYNYIKTLCDKNNIDLIIKEPFIFETLNEEYIKIIDKFDKNIHYSLVFAILYLGVLLFDNSLFEFKFDLYKFNETFNKNINYYINLIISNLKTEIKTGDIYWRIEYDKQFYNLIKELEYRKQYVDNKDLFDYMHILVYFNNYYKNSQLFQHDGLFNIILHKLKQYLIVNKLND